MTSPSPSPGPADDAPVSSIAESSPAEPNSAEPNSAVTISTAPPTQAGPLAPDALAALQSALAAEQAAVWTYGLVAAYARDQTAMIAEARSGHLLRRDATTARLIQGGATAPEPAAAYQVSIAVTDQATALALAQDIETDAAAAWRVVIGSTDDAELRGFALAGLSDAAVRLAMWKQVAGAAPTTIPFPGTL